MYKAPIYHQEMAILSCRIPIWFVWGHPSGLPIFPTLNSRSEVPGFYVLPLLVLAQQLGASTKIRGYGTYEGAPLVLPRLLLRNALLGKLESPFIRCLSLAQNSEHRGESAFRAPVGQMIRTS